MVPLPTGSRRGGCAGPKMKAADPKARRSRAKEAEYYWTTVVSTFSTHSGKKTGSRFDQPGAVAAASLID